MEMPTEDTPPQAYLPKSAYATARVAADPRTAGLEKGLAIVHAQLKQAIRDHEDQKEGVQNKTASLDALDNGCDDDIEGFELGLLGVVSKDRKHPKYQRYFPEGLREITTAEPRKEEPGMVAQMIKAMAEDATDPELAPLVGVFQSRLVASRQKVVDADKELAGIETDLAFLEDKTIPSLMADWRVEYKKLEGALTTVFASNAKKVDRFFKPFRHRGKTKKKPASPPAITPAAPPASPTGP
jgi:hypothetical protein